MLKTKIISVRMPDGIMAKIDELAKTQRYLKRSSVINHILANVLNCAQEEDLKMMASYPNMYEDGYCFSLSQKYKIYNKHSDKANLTRKE